MAGIKRFITIYICIRNEQKESTRDLQKWRSGEMNAGLKCICVEHQFGWEWIRYTFLSRGRQMLAFPMGEMRMIKGSGDYGTIIKADQIGGSEYSFAEMDGMVFAGEEGAIAMTRWTEGKPFAVKQKISGCGNRKDLTWVEQKTRKKMRKTRISRKERPLKE